MSALTALVGCREEEQVEVEEDVRPIKTYLVVEPASGDRRTYTGTLVAADTSALSFAVSGTVSSVKVAQGDLVERGQILAELDPEPFDLDVQAAQGELTSASAAFSEKQADIDRKRELYRKEWISKAALEQALSAFDTSEAQLNLARSRLSIAERNRNNAALVAPFAGNVAERSIEPFQETRAGEPIFVINAGGAMEIEISVSDSIVNRLNAGATVNVDVPNVDGCGCTARITEIGTASSAANAVTVVAAILDGPKALLPGMAAEVQVPLGDTGDDAGFLVPLTAIAPGDDTAPGYVFLFDAADGIVRKSPVESGDSAIGDLVAVHGNIGSGDIIAAAGVSFLRDGQSVKLLDE